MWKLIISSYLKNEKNKYSKNFNCFLCDIEKTKTVSNEIEIGNINKIFYVCSKECHKKFLDKEIITNLIKFENLSNSEKENLITKYADPMYIIE